jgi:hypothetical protein
MDDILIDFVYLCAEKIYSLWFLYLYNVVFFVFSLKTVNLENILWKCVKKIIAYLINVLRIECHVLI